MVCSPLKVEAAGNSETPVTLLLHKTGFLKLRLFPGPEKQASASQGKNLI
jgi:hypothetical protein